MKIRIAMFDENDEKMTIIGKIFFGLMALLFFLAIGLSNAGLE